MFVVCIIGEEIVEVIKTVNEKPEKLNKFINAVKQEDDLLCKKYKIYFLRKLALLKSELEWFSKIDLFRQSGFYCDYMEQLKNPIRITENEFNEVERKLKKVRQMGLYFIEELSKENSSIAREVKRFKNMFKKNKIDKKIEVVLQNMRKNRKRPFVALKDSFRDI